MPFKDKVVTYDGVAVGLAPAVPPNNPCPKCGKETVKHELNSRICTNKKCREIVCKKG